MIKNLNTAKVIRFTQFSYILFRMSCYIHDGVSTHTHIHVIFHCIVLPIFIHEFYESISKLKIQL